MAQAKATFFKWHQYGNSKAKLAEILALWWSLTKYLMGWEEKASWHVRFSCSPGIDTCADAFPLKGKNRSFEKLVSWDQWIPYKKTHCFYHELELTATWMTFPPPEQNWVDNLIKDSWTASSWWARLIMGEIAEQLITQRRLFKRKCPKPKKAP